MAGYILSLMAFSPLRQSTASKRTPKGTRFYWSSGVDHRDSSGLRHVADTSQGLWYRTTRGISRSGGPYQAEPFPVREAWHLVPIIQCHTAAGQLTSQARQSYVSRGFTFRLV